jgi:exodeoxyribonuclease-5
MTVWSPQQQAALDAGRAWLDDPRGPQIFYLAGYAGTGKSTLARAFNEHIGGRALAAAYTGKAASVMRSKGLRNAQTIHSLIYSPVGGDLEARHKELKQELLILERSEDAWGQHEALRAEALRRQLRSIEDDARQPKFTLKAESELAEASLLIVDEVSMVSEDMAKDLISFGTKILVLGDPAQLPPVHGASYFNDMQPDCLLTEVHRQAAESPILRLATLAREGKAIPRGEWANETGSARVVSSVTAAQALAADIVLCGTNSKRQAINRRHRQLGGHTSPMPEAGERLCCLKNDRDLGLQNGTLWDCVEPDENWSSGENTLYLRIRPEEGGIDIGVPAEASLFLDDMEKPPWSNNQFFTYGSALTVHKSQGSAWRSVVLFDDWPSNRSYREWLYTGLTRASEELILVKQ